MIRLATAETLTKIVNGSDYKSINSAMDENIYKLVDLMLERVDPLSRTCFIRSQLTKDAIEFSALFYRERMLEILLYYSLCNSKKLFDNYCHKIESYKTVNLKNITKNIYKRFDEGKQIISMIRNQFKINNDGLANLSCIIGEYGVFNGKYQKDTTIQNLISDDIKYNLQFSK